MRPFIDILKLPKNSWTLYVVQSLSHVQLFAIPWTVACQAPLSTESSREKYCSELQSPPPGSLPNPGNESGSPELQADPLMSKPPGCMPYVCVCA